ncbi:hypothetical protein K443DRAFT_677551 [Laccaria amethystina LaAM-08-1]|uniref:Uncharacterized protein n=1 Tax=Laccaria amethystina LaAM-08-1 TaxID=1095629 RepID=A0A0C9XXW8_9AGAR|nr:hypothetical protein K443DRAFT_677551 [Laccaria amethystina LaAM-08-1]
MNVAFAYIDWHRVQHHSDALVLIRPLYPCRYHCLWPSTDQYLWLLRPSSQSESPVQS